MSASGTEVTLNDYPVRKWPTTATQDTHDLEIRYTKRDTRVASLKIEILNPNTGAVLASANVNVSNQAVGATSKYNVSIARNRTPATVSAVNVSSRSKAANQEITITNNSDNYMAIESDVTVDFKAGTGTAEIIFTGTRAVLKPGRAIVVGGALAAEITIYEVPTSVEEDIKIRITEVDANGNRLHSPGEITATDVKPFVIGNLNPGSATIAIL